MRSQLAKVLHPVLQHPMLHHVLDLSLALPHSSISVIVGHQENQVRKACETYSKLQFFTQAEQKGTAHAVSMAKSFLAKESGHVLILSGDVCLLRKSSMESLLAQHEAGRNQLTLVTTRLTNPTGYGRILKKGKAVIGIREEADASPKEKKIQEINAGIYCFEIKSLLAALEKISDKNQQGEFYLTDAISYLVKQKKKVQTFEIADPAETLGVNDRVQLAEAERILQKRINEHWMRAGATLHLPDTILIDHRSQISTDVEIGPGTQIIDSAIGEGVVIEGYSQIVQSRLAARAHVKLSCQITESELGEDSQVGPFAHLRPGSKLGPQVKIGNFVEVKKSTLGKGAKASHLSYIGDAEVGEESNLGCGFITCNYDGKKKYQTKIGKSVFVGSDTQVVAPVEIGSGSFVAAGTTVTKSVPEDSLVFSRTPQTTKPGYAKKYRKGD